MRGGKLPHPRLLSRRPLTTAGAELAQAEWGESESGRKKGSRRARTAARDQAATLAEARSVLDVRRSAPDERDGDHAHGRRGEVVATGAPLSN